MAVINPSSDRVQEVAREVISRPHFRLSAEGDPNQDYPWILRKFVEFQVWLAKSLGALFDYSPLLGLMVVIGMIAILIAILIHMALFIRSIIKDRGPGHAPAVLEEAFRANPETWESMAENAASTGDYLGGVSFLFRAMIARLEFGQGKPFRRGMTSREVSRRYENTPLYEPIRMIVRTHEQTWFGFVQCFEGDFQYVREAYNQLKERVRPRKSEVADAHRP